MLGSDQYCVKAGNVVELFGICQPSALLNVDFLIELEVFPVVGVFPRLTVQRFNVVPEHCTGTALALVNVMLSPGMVSMLPSCVSGLKYWLFSGTVHQMVLFPSLMGKLLWISAPYLAVMVLITL